MPSFAFPRRRNPPAASAGGRTALAVPEARSSEARASETVGGAVVASVLFVLERPGLVPLGLAGFLVRGGIVPLLLPIVVLPTPVGLATIFGPDIVSVALAGPNPGIIRLAIIGTLIAGLWLVASGVLGAATDVALIEAAGEARQERFEAVGAAMEGLSRRRLIVRVAIVRWLAHLPLVVALAWGVVRIIEATYAELVLPSDTATPLVLRVLAASPDAVTAVALAWLVGETWGGLAARFVVLGGRSVVGSLWAGLRWLAVAPLRGLATMVVTMVVLGLVVGAGIAGSSTVWSSLRPIVRIDPGGFGMGAAVLLLVGVWLVGAAVVGLIVTWRAVVWSLVVDVGTERHRPGNPIR